jgi:hypothetical protein
MKKYEDIHQAYLGTLADVLQNPDHICSPRGQTIREKLYYGFQILNPRSECIVTKDLKRNEVIKNYTDKEKELYNSGTNLAEKFGEASKFWLKLSNPDGTINSAYGHLIKHKKSHGNPIYELFDQMKYLSSDELVNFLAQNSKKAMRTPWEWCVDALKSDKDTRQAILRFSLPEHFYLGNKDMTCTLDGNFHIRDNKLMFRVHMRSNDLTLGLAYDLPWFISLMEDMLDELSSTYKDLEIGIYTHIVDSLHIYEKDIDKINNMLGLI